MELENEVEGNLKVVVPFVSFLQDQSLTMLAANIVSQIGDRKVLEEEPRGPTFDKNQLPISAFQTSMLQLCACLGGWWTALPSIPSTMD